ncbi:MAG: histidinol-phosphate transaminase [Gammaproteobacteria bacterium]|nr:histidinol-phosphate transaminase [Gammaproteobacteria bacterium]
MKADFCALANPYIRSLTPYQPGKPIEEVERELGLSSIIKLASNENPLGASPIALSAAQKALAKAHIYPDGGCYELKHALGSLLKVQPVQITMGNGSENVLEIIMKAYLTQGHSAVVSQYAFLTIPLLIKSYGATMITVPAKNYSHDIDKMIAAVTDTTRMLFIVNPNNPTGTYTTDSDLRHLLESIPEHVLVVVDEAYREYINRVDYPDTLQLLNHYPNLIITRTFSKAYGLAALRLGYAISSEQIADILNRARLPFNVNSVAAAAGVAALSDKMHILKSIELNDQGMQQLLEGLKNLNVDMIPSLGNFITIDTKQNASDVYQKLLKQGVIVRPLGAYEMPRHIRVTIGTFEENDRFLQAFKEVL